MTPAQALWALWIAMTLGLAGCVSPSRETANTRCLEEVASSASYMSGGAPWDLATDPSDRSRGYVPGYGRGLSRMRALRVGVPDAYGRGVASCFACASSTPARCG